MKTSITVVALTAAGILGVSRQAVRADVLYNGWNYAIDSQTDGSPSSGGIYEYHGLAFKALGNKVYVAISSQMPQAGNPLPGALNNAIDHGDLFFNFSSHNLDASSKFTDPGVIGVRFDPNNDSFGNVGGSNSTLGVFDRLTVTSLTTLNSGYGTLASYAGAGWGRTSDAMADLEDNVNPLGDVQQYLGGGAMYPNILSGDQIGSISLKTRSDLAGLGLDFGHFSADPGGNEVWGFSFNRNLLPGGEFTMHMFEECINDGMALKGHNAVPEPSSLVFLSTGVLGLLGLARRRK